MVDVLLQRAHLMETSSCFIRMVWSARYDFLNLTLITLLFLWFLFDVVYMPVCQILPCHCCFLCFSSSTSFPWPLLLFFLLRSFLSISCPLLLLFIWVCIHFFFFFCSSLLLLFTLKVLGLCLDSIIIYKEISWTWFCWTPVTIL